MENPDIPPGSPEDFGRMRADEIELRRVKSSGNSLQEAEAEFQAEQRRIQLEKDRLAAQRAKIEKERTAGPAKIKHLIVAKKFNPAGGPSKFSVVGFYSSPATLAEALGTAAMAYADAGQTLGVVEFDLSVKMDQPVTPPV